MWDPRGAQAKTPETDCKSPTSKRWGGWDPAVAMSGQVRQVNARSRAGGRPGLRVGGGRLQPQRFRNPSPRGNMAAGPAGVLGQLPALCCPLGSHVLSEAFAAVSLSGEPSCPVTPGPKQHPSRVLQSGPGGQQPSNSGGPLLSSPPCLPSLSAPHGNPCLRGPASSWTSASPAP